MICWRHQNQGWHRIRKPQLVSVILQRQLKSAFLIHISNPPSFLSLILPANAVPSLQDYIYSLPSGRRVVREQHIRQWGFSLFQWHFVAEKFLKSTRYEGVVLPVCLALGIQFWFFSSLRRENIQEYARVGGKEQTWHRWQGIYLSTLSASCWLIFSPRAEKICSLSLLTSLRRRSILWTGLGRSWSCRWGTHSGSGAQSSAPC